MSSTSHQDGEGATTNSNASGLSTTSSSTPASGPTTPGAPQQTQERLDLSHGDASFTSGAEESEEDDDDDFSDEELDDEEESEDDEVLVLASPASIAVLSRRQLTLHATLRKPHGASRLVLAMSAWSVKTRRAPSRHCKECEGLWSYDYGHA